MTERKIPNMTLNEVYKQFKNDLRLCVKYHRKGKPEKVKEYFWTDDWDGINDQLVKICNSFSLIQRIQIEQVIADLHKFYIQPTEQCLKKSKKTLKPKSKSLNGGTTSEA
jgi:hypothetical protein